jgi:hypothetical protein
VTAFHYRAALDVCRRHADRLAWALQTLKATFPLTPSKLRALSDADHAVIDQFILRFSKLQDAMGARLFPALLDLLQEPGELETFIDKLNRLEKLGAIGSADDWQKFREMRNQFAHDYPDDPELQTSLLNKGYALAIELIASLERTKSFGDRYSEKG